MKNIAFILIIFLIYGCKEETVDSMYVDLHFVISLIDTVGNDLLDPETHNYYPKDSIKLYYMIDNQKVAVEVYDPQRGGDNGIEFISSTNPFMIKCFTNPEIENEWSEPDEDGFKYGLATTIIEYNSNEIDTIVAKLASKPNYLANRQIWYNGSLLEDKPFVTIIK